MPTKTKNTRSTGKASRGLSLKSKPKFNKKIALILLVVVAAFGAWRIFFAAAAPNNCQADSGVNICDVDQVAGDTDTVLSINNEALDLGTNKWGLYYGTAFRAPTAALRGAVPVYRMYNETYTWRDWVTDAQKKDKEAKYDGNQITNGIVFYAWTTQAPGTVPVYRVTRGGPHSQSFFTTDKAWVDKIIAQDAGNESGWRLGTTMPAIAFYAYPPGYKVANQVNPYDCSIRENFLSDRCKAEREALLAAEKAGTLPKTPTCPATYEIYKNAPFPGQFSAECQKKWNDYARQQSQPAPTTTQPKPSTGTTQPKPPTNPSSPVGTLPTEQQRLAAFYQAINDCKAKGWHFYDFKCNQFSKEANAWFAGIEQLRQACINRPGSQTWIPETNTCKENGGGKGGGLPGPAPAPADPNLLAYFQAVNQVKLFCSNLNPRQDVDPATLKCKPYNIGISVPPRNTWLCVIRGQQAIPKRGWVDLNLSKDIAAVNQATAARLCDEWKSSYNRQDRYRGFYATIVAR